jgi:hypothetical protein
MSDELFPSTATALTTPSTRTALQQCVATSRMSLEFLSAGDIDTTSTHLVQYFSEQAAAAASRECLGPPPPSSLEVTDSTIQHCHHHNQAVSAGRSTLISLSFSSSLPKFTYCATIFTSLLVRLHTMVDSRDSHAL